MPERAVAENAPSGLERIAAERAEHTIAARVGPHRPARAETSSVVEADRLALKASARAGRVGQHHGARKLDDGGGASPLGGQRVPRTDSRPAALKQTPGFRSGLRRP